MVKEKNVRHAEVEFRKGCGENLGESGDPDPLIKAKMVTESFYDEVKNVDFNKMAFSLTTGHFTAMVWKGTTELGCGLSGNSIVCRYCNK